MTRNLKALGSVLMAVLAFGAVAANQAVGQEPKGELSIGGSAVLTGREITEGSEPLEAFGDYVECPGSTYTGYRYNITPGEGVRDQSTTATIVPDYKEAESNCRDGANNFPVTIAMNECDYVVHVGETTVDEEEETIPLTYKATFDIVCPPNENIEIHFYLGMSHEFTVCSETVTPATHLEGADLIHNTTKGDIELKGTVEGIVVHRTGLCVEEENTTDKNGKLNLNSEITGEGESGPADVTVTDGDCG